MSETRIERRLAAILVHDVACYSRRLGAMLVAVIALFPMVAAAQSGGVDCSAFYRYPSGAWAVVHPTVIVVGNRSLPIDMSEACCFRSEPDIA